MTVEGDGFGIMKSTNLTSWTGVLKFQDIQLPVECPGGTVQQDKCDKQLWCGLCSQLGCDPKRECAGVGDDAGGDGTFVTPPRQGSCSTGDGGAWAMALGFGLFFIVRRRRS
jgi:MYXO-CTERM domain-containing protein